MAIQEDLNTAVVDARQALDQRIQSPALRMLVTTAVVAAACWAGAGLLCVVVGTLAVLLSIAAISLFTLGGFLFVGACVAGAWAFALSWAAAWAYIAGTVFQGMTSLVSRSYRNIVQPRIASNTSNASSKRGMAVAASQRPKAGDNTTSNDSNNMSSNRNAKSTESDNTPTPVRTPGAQGAQRRGDMQQLPHSTDAVDSFPLTTGQDKLREPTAAQKLQPFATNGVEGDAPATFKEAVLHKEPWEGVASAGGNPYNSNAAIDSAQFVGHKTGAPTAAGGPQLFSTALRSAMVQ